MAYKSAKVYTGSEWVELSITAVQGAQGPTGAGAQGVQGTQGVQGYGYSQSQGTQGTQGVQGYQGVQGTQGVQSPQGVQGYQGTQGLQGYQGVQSPQGVQGYQGTIGTTPSQTVVYNRSGAVSITTGTQRFRFPASATILGASMALNTGGTTATTVVVKRNGSALTFANALSLTGTTSSGTGLAEQAITSTAACSAGDYLTVDITAAGTSAADLTVFIRYQ